MPTLPLLMGLATAIANWRNVQGGHAIADRHNRIDETLANGPIRLRFLYHLDAWPGAWNLPDLLAAAEDAVLKTRR